ncbi:type I secretion system permease/ATPase [Bartonella sp. HY329]|uniref:type I secretion system permease/ATPase n=1 Tax=unclassified Bartonella TaxID=2645622 RepID=UPI0021C673F1|nr:MULTISPECIES: type I secretion system permease/ATPase [unclassified Bartonella]UXM94098.1 type I secretion system permease/ATPase [Bartonella sp. HY329]UXN08420.1 type I secretion system permease/ATPase [Bartonella sp. HY328]
MTDKIENISSIQPAFDATKWTDVLLLAARQLSIKSSPELVRNAAAWTKGGDPKQSTIDIALACGLNATYLSIDESNLSNTMLPCVIEIGKELGLLTAFDEKQALIHFVVNGKSFERRVALDQLFKAGKRQILLLDRHEAVRDDRLDKYLEEKPQSWLRGIFTSNWPLMVQLGLGSLFGNLLAIGTSLFAMQVWDRVVPSQSLSTLWVLFTGVAIAMIMEFLMRMSRVSVTDYFGKLADLKLSGMFFSRTLNIRNDSRPRSPGTLVSQLRDLDQIRELLTSSTLGVLIDLPFVTVFLAIIWALGGPLVWIPILAIPLIILPGIIAQIPLAKLANAGLDEAALRNAVLMESIYRAEDIKLLQAEPRFRNVWDNVNKTSGDISLKQRKWAALLMHFSQMIQQLAYVGVIVAGVYGILNNVMSFGAVLACSILTSRTIAPLAQIPGILGRLQNARVGKKALDGLLTLPVDHDSKNDYYHKPVILGNFDFTNVAYAYGPMEKPALVIPRLTVTAGERIAVLGRVGAGKSTLLRMIAGLSAPVQGQITLDGTPMKIIDIADIRRDVGAMLQESSLFYGTLRDNLLIGSPLASDEDILKAMRLACADKLLLNQPHGLDLKLRESGIGLSGGQKQALMLSRLYLRSPNVVILDEPTASLDEGTEVEVLRNLQQWLTNRTLIVATHRYPVLSLVDRILIVDNGRIIRDGPKDEILKAMSAGQQAVQPTPTTEATKTPNPYAKSGSGVLSIKPAKASENPFRK